MKTIPSFLLNCIPQNNNLIYRICKHYVDNFNGENNSDMKTNGELYAMQRFLPKTSIVFDVGANTGEWTFHALKINPSLNIYCFEPSSETYAQLLARDFPPNVLCNNFGMSSTNQNRPLYILGMNSRMNSIYKRSGLEEGKQSSQVKTEMISLETLDRYCKQRNIAEIGYLKLDIEGHEIEALKGAFELLSRGAIKVIQFEYGGCNIDARVLLKDFFELFEKFPYSFYKLFPYRLKHVERYSQRLENFQYQNWLILHHDTR